MMLHRLAAVVIAAVALNACAAAGSSGLTTATLRDGARVAVSLTTAEPGRYLVRIGPESFTGDYFADEGDQPSVRVVKLDARNDAVVVTAPGPVDCRYDVFGDANGATRQLATITSSHCRAEPRFPGNGTIESVVWEGFWERPVIYVRQPAGAFAAAPSRYVAVGVEAPAAHAFTAGTLAIPAGTTVRVVQYDLETQQYELLTGAGRAWVASEGLSDLLPGLAWAE